MLIPLVFMVAAKPFLKIPYRGIQGPVFVELIAPNEFPVSFGRIIFPIFFDALGFFGCDMNHRAMLRRLEVSGFHHALIESP